MWAYKLWEDTLDHETLFKRLHHQDGDPEGSKKKTEWDIFILMWAINDEKDSNKNCLSFIL